MTPEDISLIRQVLPETMTFHHYPDRQSPWLLANAMPGDMPVRTLRQGPLARFLDRPLVKPVVAGCGGMLRQRDLIAVAHAGRAMQIGGLSAGALSALDIAYASTWRDYELSFASWGTGRDWAWEQVSRKGGNLVMQLGFPSEHAAILGRHFSAPVRKDFEVASHPIRSTGRPTLAWVRMDVDLASGTALIEEVQSDWLRKVRRKTIRLRRISKRFERAQRAYPQSRQLKTLESYEAGLRAAYAQDWAKFAMLATLTLLFDEFAVRDIWMHQPGPGAVLKNIHGTPPPRSLYTDLPKSFGFRPTHDVPAFLERPCRKALKRLRQRGDPLFWRLQLGV